MCYYQCMRTLSNQPDHRLKSLHDSAAFVGELEHVRRHAIRSAHIMGRRLLDNPDDEHIAERGIHYFVVSQKCLELRRTFMEEEFGFVEDEDWCLLKGTAALRQLAYELMPQSMKVLDGTEVLVDTVWGNALGEDMSGCKSCKEDREDVNNA